MIDKKSPIILTGLLHIQFIAYKQTHPVHLVVLNETSCLSIMCILKLKLIAVYSSMTLINVRLSLHLCQMIFL